MIGAQIQAAIYSTLTGLSPPPAGGRIYDQVPETPTFPYITIGDEQILDDGNACEEGWESFSDIHIWDRPVSGSKATLKGLIADVADAVIGISSITDFRVLASELESSRVFRDADGKTEHAVLTFRMIVSPN